MKNFQVNGYLSLGLIFLLSLVLSTPLGAQSWMKAFGTNGYCRINLFVTYNGKLYLNGSFDGPDSLISSNISEGKIIKSDSTYSNFMLMMNYYGKVQHAFSYSGLSVQSNIVAEDNNGNFTIVGSTYPNVGSSTSKVVFPGDSFSCKSTYANGVYIANAPIICIDSTGNVKWHYLFTYRNIGFVGTPRVLSAHFDSAGNSYYIIVGNNIIIENDTIWNNQIIDSNNFLLKLDPNGKYLWHKRMRNSNQMDIDQNGNFVFIFDYNGFKSNSIVLMDKNYQIKWVKIYYKGLGNYLSNAAFTTSGTILVDYSDGNWPDSIFEYDMSGKIMNHYPNLTSVKDFYALTHGKGLFINSQSDNYYSPFSNLISLKGAENGDDYSQSISYFTKYASGPNGTWANLNNVVVGTDNKIYCTWILNSDALHPKPNILHTKFSSVQGIGLGSIIVARLSPDSFYYLNINQANIETHTIQVFPNPASDRISIKLSDHSNNSVIEIFDVNSKLIRSQNFASDSPEIDISYLKAGMYILKLQNGPDLFYGKFVKTVSE